MVVLVHGYPDTKEVWNPVMERLAARYHVIAYDVRGAGGSTAPRGPGAYRLDRLADDFAAVCAGLVPGRRVHLVGHDWGGVQGDQGVRQPPRFAGQIASICTSIAGPALSATPSPPRAARCAAPGSSRRPAARDARGTSPRSACPGVRRLIWRVLMRGGRWRTLMGCAERVPVGEDYPAPGTVCADGLHGANLYRANIPRRLISRAPLPAPHAPVQLIVPSEGPFLSDSYYAAAGAVAPGLRRRTVAGSHWAPRSQPDLVARCGAGVRRRCRRTRCRAGPAVGARRRRGPAGRRPGPGDRRGQRDRPRDVCRAPARGARVIMVDRDRAEVIAGARPLPGARPVVCDVADKAGMERMAAEVLARDGVPDIVVNNAGIGVAGPFIDTGAADWRAIVDIDLIGVVTGCRLFSRAMIDRGMGGQIVNAASGGGVPPHPQPDRLRDDQGGGAHAVGGPAR